MSDGANGRQRLAYGLGLALAIVLLGYVVWRVFAQAQGINWANVRLAPIYRAASLLLAAYVLRAVIFAGLIRSLGERGGTVAMLRVFFVAQLGRYLPGKVWQFAGVGMLGDRYGLDGPRCVASSLWVALTHHLVGAVLTLLVLWQLPSLRSAALTAVALLSILCVALVATPMLERLLGMFFRRQADTLRRARPRVGIALAMLLCSAAVWGLFGLALVEVTTMFGGDHSLGVAEAVGSIAASAVVGYAAVIVPSGLGVREATLVALTEPALGPAVSAAVAIALRLVMTIVELLLSLWGAVPLVRRSEAG